MHARVATCVACSGFLPCNGLCPFYEVTCAQWIMPQLVPLGPRGTRSLLPPPTPRPVPSCCPRLHWFIRTNSNLERLECCICCKVVRNEPARWPPIEKCLGLPQITPSDLPLMTAIVMLYLAAVCCKPGLNLEGSKQITKAQTIVWHSTILQHIAINNTGNLEGSGSRACRQEALTTSSSPAAAASPGPPPIACARARRLSSSG